MKKKKLAVSNSIHQIQKRIFSTQLILILLLAIVLGGAGIIINVTFETQKRDRNLQNISQTIATSPLLDDMGNSANTEYLTEYFDSLQKSLGDIDAISIVSVDNVRLYHTNHALIGTTYDGTLPIFEDNEFYAEDNDGPSGKQRRAYAAIYDEDGNDIREGGGGYKKGGYYGIGVDHLYEVPVDAKTLEIYCGDLVVTVDLETGEVTDNAET